MNRYVTGGVVRIGVMAAALTAVAALVHAFAGCKQANNASGKLNDFPLAENPAGAWTQYAANEAHDTFVGGRLSKLEYAGKLNKKPLFDSFMKQSGGMVAADGRIFVPNDRGRMLALDAESGDIVWADKTNLSSGRQFTSPTYYRGLLYCGTQPGGIVCLDAQTGEPVWEGRQEAAMKGVRTCPTFADDKLVFVDIKSRAFCLNALTGEELWRLDTSGAESAVSDPVMLGDNAVFGTPAGVIYSVDAKKGTVTFAEALSHSVESSPCAIGDSVYFTGIDGGVYISNEMGDVRKLFSMTGRSNAVPLVHDNRVVVSDDDNFVYCLSAETGELLWKVEVEGAPLGIVMGFDDALVVFTSINAAYDSFSLRLTDARGDLDDFIRRKAPFLAVTAAEAAEYESMGKVEREEIGEFEPRPISEKELRELFPGGIKYLLARRARYYAISWDGRILQESALPEAMQASPILYEGKIYILDINGYIHVFRSVTV